MNPAKNFFNITKNYLESDNIFRVGLFLVFCAMNGLVLVNAILHNPSIGYDAIAHLKYIEAFSRLQFVTPQESNEFFSPPLPYLFPSFLIAIVKISIENAAKFAQYLNVLLSIGLTVYVIKICDIISSRYSLKFSTLCFLAIIPVYYKTFAFVRGEPFVAFFATGIMYYTLLISLKEQFTTKNILWLGIFMGLCALSRQWGFFLFPPVFLLLACKWLLTPQKRLVITRAIFITLVLIALICGWFYLGLHIKYGSITAFNRESSNRFSLANQPTAFYVGISSQELFDRPVRPNFTNQLIPIFYSELWGDYWCYFSVYAKNTVNSEFISGKSLGRILEQGDGIPGWVETNYETMGQYLGKVNRIALFPSLIAISALISTVIQTIRKPKQKITAGFLLLTILSSAIGYFTFLVMYPDEGKGDTIKATYILQIFPSLAILVGLLFEKIRTKSRLLYFSLLAGLFICFMFFLPVIVTHFRMFNMW